MKHALVTGATGYLGEYVARVFSRHDAGLLYFFMAMMTSDMVAPVTGTHTLGAFFNSGE